MIRIYRGPRAGRVGWGGGGGCFALDGGTEGRDERLDCRKDWARLWRESYGSQHYQDKELPADAAASSCQSSASTLHGQD